LAEIRRLHRHRKKHFLHNVIEPTVVRGQPQREFVKRDDVLHQKLLYKRGLSFVRGDRGDCFY